MAQKKSPGKSAGPKGNFPVDAGMKTKGKGNLKPKAGGNKGQGKKGK